VLCKVMDKFYDDPDLPINVLKIIAGCLRHLREELVVLRMSSDELAALLVRILRDEKKTEEDKTLSFDVLIKLSRFASVHQTLVANGVTAFLRDTLEQCLRLESGQLKNEQLGLLARSFHILTSLFKNQQMSAEVASTGLMDKFLSVHNRFKDSEYLNELFISSLHSVSSSFEGTHLLKSFRVELKSMVISSVSSQNKRLLEQTEHIILKLMRPEDLAETIAKVKEGQTEFENLAYLAFLSRNEMMVESLEDSALVRMALGLFDKEDLRPEQQFGLIKFLNCVIAISEKMANLFNELRGAQTILSKIKGLRNYIVWAEYARLLDTLLLNMTRERLDKELPEEPFKAIVAFFEETNAQLDSFQRNALTAEKALDSIEFNKNEMSRSILLEMKTVKQEELVSSQMALDYLSSEQFVQCAFLLLKHMGEFRVANKFDLGEPFVVTCTSLMKVFRNSKVVHELMFGMLSACRLDGKLGALVLKSNWPFLLSDVVWKKPNWKFFACHVMKTMETIAKNPENERLVKGNVNLIKLIASIKNFITEEDYKDFEEGDDEAKDRGNSDVLSFAQEREVHKKGTELVGYLTDVSTQTSFRNTIEKSVSLFKPKQESVQILRAEYAVISCLNGDNFFGANGLKGNLHRDLADNIEKIERSVQGRHFPDKEKLMADCIRSLANFVCITWNESGKNAYEKAGVSQTVFALLEKYLKGSNAPLHSYVVLKAFKEWLVNRIEIIENVSNMERDKIYDPESFMMLPQAQRDATLTVVMDSLYLTHQRFSTVEKVVSLNFEVIILLGYVYPKWRSKVAKNFIPQVLDSLNQDGLSMEADLKATDLLNQFIGIDGPSEDFSLESLEAAVANNALEKICKSVVDNRFEVRYLKKVSPLLQTIGEFEVKTGSKATQDLVLGLLDRLRGFNELTPQEKALTENLEGALKTLEQLNSLGLVPHLQKLMLDNKHPETVGSLWQFVNGLGRSGGQNEALAHQISKGCTLGVSLHLGDETTRSDNLKLLMGNPKTFKFQSDSSSLLVNAIKSLQKHPEDPECVLLNARLLNSCFPSAHSLTCKKIAQELDFQPTLETLFRGFGSSDNRELCQEANALYFNLTTKADDDIVDKMVRKILRKFKQDMATGNVSEIESAYLNLTPFQGHPVFMALQSDLSADDYILKTLMLLHAKLKEKLDKTTLNLLNDALGSPGFPDLGESNKKVLADEVSLAKTLTDYVLNLPDPLKQKVAAREEVARLVDVGLLLDGRTRVFELLDMFVANDNAKRVLAANRGFEICSYALLKHTKDSFKPMDFPVGEPIGGSLLTSAIGASSLTKSMLGKSKLGKGSQITVSMGDESHKGKVLDEEKAEALQRVIDKCAGLSQKLLSKAKGEAVLGLYAKEMGEFEVNNQKRLTNALAVSRIFSCLLAASGQGLSLDSDVDNLHLAYLRFLKEASKEPNLSRKLMRFFEGTLVKVAKRVNAGPKSFRNGELWNALLERYFVVAPESLKANHRKVLKGLDLVRPELFDKDSRRRVFEERSGDIRFAEELSSALLSVRNSQNTQKVLDSLLKTVQTTNVDHGLTLGLLEALTKSREFTKALVGHPMLEVLLTQVAGYSDFEDQDKFESLTEALMNCLTVALTDSEARKALNERVHSDNLMKLYLENVENLRKQLLDKSYEALALMFGAVENKLAFFDKRIPEKVLDNIGPSEDWSARDVPALLLLGLTLRDPSLHKVSAEQGLLESALQRVRSDLLRRPSETANAVLPFTKQLNELSKDPTVQKNELTAFILGELSKYEANASKLAQEQNSGLFLDMYDCYERHDNQPVIATKMIEATRNAVYCLSDEAVAQHGPAIDKMLDRIPGQISKFRGLVLVPRYLQEIYDFFKKPRKPPAPSPFHRQATKGKPIVYNFEQADTGRGTSVDERHSRLQTLGEVEETEERLSQSKAPEAKVEATSVAFEEDPSEVYKYLRDKVERGPFSSEDAKIFEEANQGFLRIIKAPTNTNVYSMMNLSAHENLRVIANSINSTVIQKLDALKVLNQILEAKDTLPKFVEDDFYVSRSAELIGQLVPGDSALDALKPAERDLLLEDLKFMKRLTDEPEGVVVALEVDKSHPIIKSMVGILKSESRDQAVKVKAVEVLNNLLKAKSRPELEAELMGELAEVFERNIDELPLVTPLTELCSTLLKDSPSNKQAFLDQKLLAFSRKAIERFPNQGLLNNAVSGVVCQLAKDFPSSHETILESPIMPYLAKAFSNPGSDKALHENMADTLLEVGYGNADNKKRLIRQGFTGGLVALLNHYSSPANFDEDMCQKVLKLIANFSSIPEGVEVLLKDGVIPAFNRFFDRYKDKLPVHNKVLMASLANMAYDGRPDTVDRIIADKGLDLIVDALQFYTGKKEPETTECAIDALTFMAVNPKAVKGLEDSQVVDGLVDLVRSQLTDKLVFASLGCLSSFAAHDVFADKIFRKGGQDAAADVFRLYRNDPKNLVQATKLIDVLTDKYPDRSIEFIRSGVPKKLTDQFDAQWP
jgi:hypothetical protein